MGGKIPGGNFSRGHFPGLIFPDENCSPPHEIFIINLFILYICIIFSCNYLHKTGFAIFAVLPCVTSWAMYPTAKYIWKTSPSKLRGKSITHTTSKQELLVTLVTTVKYRHKDIYCRYCRGTRYASETSYYKKFENEEL